MEKVGIKKAYDEFDPVTAFRRDVCGYISASFVTFHNVDFHGDG